MIEYLMLSIFAPFPNLWVSDLGAQSLREQSVKKQPLFEDFESSTLNPSMWLIARSQWGGKDINGGVVPENIHLRAGKLLIKAHGDQYAGPVKGVQRVGGRVSPIAHGRRTGACLVTRESYASGRYEARIKVPLNLGVCSALWTFDHHTVDRQHEDFLSNNGEGGSYVSNHEIDIELPGRPGPKASDIGYDRVLFNTWVGERAQDMTLGPTKLPFEVNDGKFHTWRFDWHTGDPNGEMGKPVEPRVDFYLDGELLRSVITTVPAHAGRFWIGTWFPDKWAGRPDFEVETLEVDWVRITPFNEPGDRHQYSKSGPTPLLIGAEDWPERLRAKKKKEPNQGQE